MISAWCRPRNHIHPEITLPYLFDRCGHSKTVFYKILDFFLTKHQNCNNLATRERKLPNQPPRSAPAWASQKTAWTARV